MRNLKRALSLALASVMLLGMMVVGTSASYADVTSKNNQEAIEVAQAAGIMVGDANGNFNPDAKVTRNEMAVVMANMLSLKVDDFKNTKTGFTDVPAWAEPYVAACRADGIIAGYSATYFGGSDTVTAAQAGLMMLKALGYFQYASDFGDDWKLTSVKQASKIDLYDEIDAGSDTALTRNDVAQLVLNALEADMVEPDGNGGTTIKGDGFEITTGSTKYTEVVKAKDSDKKWDAIDDGKDSDNKKIVQLGEQLFDGDLKKETKSDDMGRPASIWSYKGDEIGQYSDKADYTFVVTDSNADINNTSKYTNLLDYVQDVLNDDDLNWKYVNNDNKTNYAFNGTKTATAVRGALDRGTIVEIWTDDDDNDIITDMVAYYYTLQQIDEVDTDVKSADAKKGVSAYITIDGTEYKDTDIPGYDPKTYVEDAYVAILVNPKDSDKLIESYIPTKVEGAIEGYKVGERVTMNGTKYTVVAQSYTLGALDTGVTASLSTDKNDKYALYLDKNGYILGIDEVDATTSIDDVYYLVKVWKDNENEYGAQKDLFYAQVVDMNGVVKEIELENYYDKTSTTATLAAMKPAGGSAYDFSSLQDNFYTISDKKITSGNTTLSKANNDKYNLEAWPNADEAKDWDKQAVTFNAGEKLSTSATRVATDHGTYKLNSETKYLVLEETGKDLEATVKVGGLSYSETKLTAARARYIITEDDSKTAKIVVIATNASDTANAYSDDVLFIESDSEEFGDGFRDQTVYWADGKKETIKVDDDKYPLGRGFYTYDTNSDGYYVLEVADALTVDNAFTWDDQDGVIVNATFVSYKDGMLTVSVDGKTVSDIDVTSDVVYKDIHSTSKADGQYDKTVNSLKALDDGINVDEGKTPKFGDATLSLNVSEDGVVSVFVTDIAKHA